MCLGMGLFASTLVGTLCFLDLHVYFLHQIKEVFFHYFFQISFQFLALSLLLLAPLWWECRDSWIWSRGCLYYPHVFGFFFLVVVLIGGFSFLMFQIFDLTLSFIYSCFPVNSFLFQLVRYFPNDIFYAVEVLTKFLEHPYHQFFELCIW